MLSHIAPAVLGTDFVGVIRVFEFAGYVHGFATEVDAGRPADGPLVVVVFFEWHG
jgi:hypothetical protein